MEMELVWGGMKATAGEERKKERKIMTYLNQETGIVHGGLLLKLLDDAGLNVRAGLRDGRSRAGTE